MTDPPDRSDVPEAYRWDLERLYGSAEAWEADAERAAERRRELSALVDAGIDDGEALREAVRRYEDLAVDVEKLLVYAKRRRDVGLADGPGRVERARALAGDVDAVEREVADALADWDGDRLDRAVETTDGLGGYESYLRDLWAEATRDGPVAAVVADLDPVLDAPGEIHRSLLADLSVPPVEDAGGETVRVGSNYLALLRRPDRTLRRNAFEALYGALAGVENAAAAALDASVRADVRTASIRGYDSAREMVLDGDDVPVAVLDAATTGVADRLALHRDHLAAKRRRLGVEELRPWDAYVPVADAGTEFPYDEATDRLVEAVAPLGEAYRSRLAAGLDDRWVDAFPHAGKRPDAYHSAGYDTRPFVSVGYRGDVASAFRLAHELGHAMHAQYAGDAQPYVYSNPPSLLAEVASTVAEVLLYEHLRDDDALGLAATDHFLETLRAKLFRHAMLTRFEERLHDAVAGGDPLVPRRLGDRYVETIERFYEPVRFDDRAEHGWVRIRQLFSPYSGYHYVTGVGVAVAVVRRLRAGDLDPESYLDLLRAGGRESPVDALAGLGVDPRSPDLYDAVGSLYRSGLDRLAAGETHTGR